jgi:hypothetical protein
MTIEARVRELDARHQSLKDTIARESRGLSVDSLHIRELKLKKLKIKEEIERMRSHMRQESDMAILQ